MTIHRGSCHCGAVRFEVESDIEAVTECNCSICTRKGVIHHRVPAHAFRLLAGAEVLIEYRFGTGTARHPFCRHCGIHPYSHPRTAPEDFSVNVRCLERFEEIMASAERIPFDGQHWEEAARRLAPGRDPAPRAAGRPVEGSAPELGFRAATADDAALLAAMNADLIRDEGHRNPMTVPELKRRMAGWLAGGYRAVLFETDAKPVGYALFRLEPEHVHLRQFFVRPQYRRRGVGRQALGWLRESAWSARPRVRVEVLEGNRAGRAFWRAAGFAEYCLVLERPR